MDYTCPDCQTEFEAEPWNEGECPNCKKRFYWSEECLEDYSDCWAVLEWK